MEDKGTMHMGDEGTGVLGGDRDERGNLWVAEGSLGGQIRRGW